MSETKSAPESGQDVQTTLKNIETSAVGFVSTVLGYPARSKILQGFSSPDEVSNGARVGEFAVGRRSSIQPSPPEIAGVCTATLK
jgi:hypothetical protein